MIQMVIEKQGENDCLGIVKINICLYLWSMVAFGRGPLFGDVRCRHRPGSRREALLYAEAKITYQGMALKIQRLDCTISKPFYPMLPGASGW